MCAGVRRHADIDGADVKSDGASKHVHGRAASGEVGHHLGGDVLWVGAYALRGNAMVGREYCDDTTVDRRPIGPLHAGDLLREQFQTAE